MTILAETAQVSQRQYLEVLSNKVGSTGSSHNIADSERDVILEHCREAMETFGY